MNPSTILSILFSLTLIFISHAPLPASSLNLHQTVCSETSVEYNQKYDECVKALEVDPQIPSANTYVTLSKLIIEIAIKNSTGIQDYLKILRSSDPSPAINSCAIFDFTRIIQDFKSALAIVASSPQSASNEVSDAQSRWSQCGTSIQNEPKPHYELLPLIDHVLFFCQILYKSISHI
ncbi:hypothetical protein RIF29_21249 [Crotalaria pallida]|uniref:Pectinesterase inhibitor domain-containing protein n=1 Tax=Crotalaria pallida TaxID=3830 RepID=A0AAN9FB75_CROPI